MTDVFRTPDERFEGLPGYEFAPHWHDADGLRLHYVDEGFGDPVVCFHGEPNWTHLLQEDRGEEIAEWIVEFTGSGGR
jgi:haloalkane dehalogenase